MWTTDTVPCQKWVQSGCWWYTVLSVIYLFVSFVHKTFLFEDICLILIIKYHRNNK
jgi:hypothetical protein